MRTNVFSLPGELYQSRKLILRLAKNDFKTKYAGSYLGIIWAFIQPLVTIFVYWFVFSNLRAGAVRDVPFVLWLVAGLVPWFFFQDALNSGTNALLEYHYLVKKVVFRISVLPVVKLVSACFVHLFFVAVLFFLYVLLGYLPGPAAIQVIYYSAAVFLLALGLTYLTSSVVVLLKLNPMYYIVEGYRDALINGRWFWQRPVLTAYYWIFTAAVFVLGTRIFGKLKVHFADVL